MTAAAHYAPMNLAGSVLGDVRHICAFFSSRDDEYHTMLPFMREGLAAGERLVNFMPEDRTSSMSSSRRTPTSKRRGTSTARRCSSWCRRCS
jgi:hypothetical protein